MAATQAPRPSSQEQAQIIQPQVQQMFTVNNQIWSLDGVITPDGWFYINPLVFKSNALNDRFNKYYYRDVTIASTTIILNKENFFNIGENGRITEWEDTQIDGYIEYWPWKKLIECDEPTRTPLTQVFYANMKFIGNP
jgi:hypothetical protein